MKTITPFQSVLLTAFTLASLQTMAGERWDPTKLADFPEPPPPLKLVEAFPQLEIPKLIALNRIPNTAWLLAVDHANDWGGPGRVYQFPQHSNPSQDDLVLFLQLPDIIYGLAFHPQFTDNRYVYIGCNGHSENLQDVATKIIRLRVAGSGPFVCEPASAEVIIEWKSNGHNGGDLAFGNDGMLYISSGDGTSDSDTDRNGQNLSTLNGGILRIDVNGEENGLKYRIPPDNPFVDLAAARGELWAYGLRNPWRLTFDQNSGQLWVGNNGQDLWESVYLVEKGHNYGWSIQESNHPFHPEQVAGPHPISPATVEHHHSEARSLTGGHVYRGTKYPWLTGAYVYGDYSTGNIWAIRHNGHQVLWQQQIARSTAQITGFTIDSDNELLVADHAGNILRLTENTKLPRSNFPTWLSETGLFDNVSSEAVLAGVHEYYVNSPLWSDGAEKRRWLALPAGQTVGFRERGAWEFPDDSVLIKSFAFPTDPTGQLRRIETRLMTRREGEWYGYSYRWNAAQDDARLVEPEGRNEQLDWIVEAGQELSLTWRYPSRSECMVCHSRAAGFVLGLATDQLNRPLPCAEEIDPDNAVSQLAKLHSSGLLRDVKAGQDFSELPSLANPYHATADLTARVRSYLHVNCANCHVDAGGGNSKIVLDNYTQLDKMALLNQPPLHTNLQIEQAKLIAIGEPTHSILLARMARRGASQMPPLATNRVDERAIQLIQDWIESLPEE